ncbi:hypothetical protein [Gorillibacterium massiliense]|uniref:hypothetical protein n=1 Tax=Gorillibacterium massiliense TaxID=1280390 RepID=UPI0004BCDDFA|nr:hypothetical protein [Gorillibacterium massiliense]
MEDKSAKEHPVQGKKPVQREITYNIGRKRGTIRAGAAPASSETPPSSAKISLNRPQVKEAMISARREKLQPEESGTGDRLQIIFQRYLWRTVPLPKDKTMDVLLWAYAACGVAIVGFLVISLAILS